MLIEPLSKPPFKKSTAYSDETIERCIEVCPRLASLQSINKALGDLVRSDSSLNSQIAEIIRKDPSLSARLLRMVNSVYFGLSARVNNIEEAVFFLGLRQIRELSMATPVLEELEQLQHHNQKNFPWKSLWTHSIGTAVLTREILSATTLHVDDDTDYLSGLLHNVGKVVMAYSFPTELRQLMTMPAKDAQDFCRMERELIGWDHARIGAHFLERHHLSAEIIAAVRYHNTPIASPRHAFFAAAVQVAEHLLRYAGINSGFEQLPPVEVDSWLELDGWKILHGGDNSAENRLALASIAGTVQRLPAMLEGLMA